MTETDRGVLTRQGAATDPQPTRRDLKATCDAIKKASRSYWRQERKDRKQWRRAARVVKGVVQMPVHTWVHPDGRRITLIGMIHLADPGFYPEVLRRIAVEEEAGAQVFYERVKAIAAEEAATWPEWEAEAHQLLVRFMERGDERGKRLGLITQQDQFLPHIKANWTRADLTMLDVLLMCGPRRLALWLRSVLATDLLKATKQQDTVRARRRGRKNMVRAYRWTSRLNLRLLPGRLDRKVILDWRNIEAADKLLDVPAGSRAVGAWGSLHLDGIGLALYRNEFRLMNVDWVPALREQPPTSA